jgi:predicted O-methyltransferase YrrM
MIDFEFARTIKGFMTDEEAEKLYNTALDAATLGPCLEIGSYCGKSAYFLGLACKQRQGILFSLDHHRGSEEQQPGEEYFDPELFDQNLGRINTFNFFQTTLERAGLLSTVVPIVSDSKTAARMWATQLSLLFIDGGHSFEAASNDLRLWAPHIMKDGFLVIHDIFFDEALGGQAPRKIYESALASGDYEAVSLTQTLGVLRRC